MRGSRGPRRGRRCRARLRCRSARARPADRARRRGCCRSGRPIGTRASAAPRSWVSDQTVVSVGPYMLVRRAGVTDRIRAPRAADRASPPTSQWRNRASPGAAAASSTSIDAIDGVHWKCVTPWLAMSCATGGSGSASRRPATRCRTAASASNDASTRSTGTPKSMRQAISSTPMARSRSTVATHVSMRCRTGRRCRSSVRTSAPAARPAPRPRARR